MNFSTIYNLTIGLVLVHGLEDYRPETSKLFEYLTRHCSLQDKMIPNLNDQPVEIEMGVGLYKLLGISNTDEKYCSPCRFVLIRLFFLFF